MLTAQQELKKKIETLENERLLENVKCFVMGMNAQKEIDRKELDASVKERNARKEV